MAGTGQAGGQYRAEMDGPAHEATYDSFTHFTTVGAVFVATIVLALAVGGVKGAWVSTVIMVVLSMVATAIGLASVRLSWRPPAAVFGVLLLMLILY